MPDPVLEAQIDDVIAELSSFIPVEDLPGYRQLLMEAADRAEAGDQQAMASLAAYGITVEPMAGPSPAGQNYPSMEDYSFGGLVPTAPTPVSPAASKYWPGTENFPPGYTPPVPPPPPPTPSFPIPGPVPDSQYVRIPGTNQVMLVGNTIVGKDAMGDPIWAQGRIGGPYDLVVAKPEAAITEYQKGLLAQDGARLAFDIRKWQATQAVPRAPVAPYYGAPTETQAAQTALAQAKYALDVAKFQASQPQAPLMATTNPLNPNEDSQRREWMRARIANGENPYDYGAFAEHMAGIGAPAAPSYEGFFEVANYEQGYQQKQDALAQAERNYQQRLAEIAAGQALTPYQAGQLELQGGQLTLAQKTQAEEQALRERQQKWSEFGTTLEAAKTGQPLTYLSLLRGTVPGAGGGAIYQGLYPVVPTLAGAVPGAAPGIVGAGTSTAGVTPDMMARVRSGLAKAGWPGGSDQEAIATYLKTAVPDEFSRQLQAASSGQAASSAASSGLQDVYGGGGNYTSGSYRLPNTQLALEGPSNVQRPGSNYASGSYTPEQMARVRRGLQLAGWPQVGTAGDTEAVEAYLKTAVPDEFSRSLQAVSGGAPAMPPAMETISRGEPLSAPSWPTGALRLPGVQAQANETPTERLARYEALAFQGIPDRDVEDFERRIRLSLGPGLSAGAYRPSPLRLR